jgi:hypothetical protein
VAVKVIKAAAGLGKTSMLVKLLDDTLYGKVEIYVPTHDLGGQVAESLTAAFQHHVVIKGRSQPAPNGTRMCARHVEAELLLAKGYPVYPILCARRDQHGGVERCGHYDTCAYIAQFQGPQAVFVYTHSSLSLERGVLEDPVPQLVVIDESFFASCIEIFPVPLGDLISQPAGSHAEKVCMEVIGILKAGKPLLATFRSSGLETSLRLAIAEHKPTLPHFSPYWTERKQQRALKALAARPPVLEMLETLRDELATGRDESHAFLFDPIAGVIRVHRRRPVTRFGGGKHDCDVLILDADADLLLVRQWFPDATLEAIPAERKAGVVQCTSTRCSTTSLVPARNKDSGSSADAQRRLDELQALINRKAAGGKRLLVVGPQAVTGNMPAGVPPLITVPSGSELAHFGAIRGVDRWKDFDAVIVVGRNQPPIQAVESIARAIWFDDPQPLEFADDWALEKRGYRVRGNLPALGVEVVVHPDKRVQAVLEQLRERESTQAIDRLRLIHATKPKEVILLSNIPLDVDVDELRSWDEIVHGTRLERAWATLDGVMPLAPAWLSERFPDLWTTPEAAEADLREFNRPGGMRYGLPPPGSTTLSTFHYRVHGQKRHSRAISVLPLPRTQAELSRLIGGVPTIVRELSNGVPGPEHFGSVGKVTLPPVGGSGEC